MRKRNMKTETIKHPDTVAWEKWVKTTQGHKCLAGTTSFDEILEISGEYLYNRLWHAFMAGRETNESRDNNLPAKKEI